MLSHRASDQGFIVNSWEFEMPVHDFSSPRIYIDAPMSKGASITTTRAHYMKRCNILHPKEGHEILVFNGRDGEWRAQLTQVSKTTCAFLIKSRTREQSQRPQIECLFAPLQTARLDSLVQKAVEMGVGKLRPVITDHTIFKQVNIKHIAVNVIEAAQQCAILNIPHIEEPVSLSTALANWPKNQPLVFADESAKTQSPLETLRGVQPGPMGVLIGPEAGFSPKERQQLFAKTYVIPISLGPRIMRADTAAVATLALVNACLGDWR